MSILYLVRINVILCRRLFGFMFVCLDHGDYVRTYYLWQPGLIERERGRQKGGENGNQPGRK